MTAYQSHKINYRTFITPLLVLILLLCSSKNVSAQLFVNDNLTPLEIARTLVGPGVTISRVTITGAPRSYGRFRSVNTNLGLDSGIVLSNGRVLSNVTGIGVNGLAGDQASFDFGEPGDPDLDRLVGNLANTYDACVLEFDIEPIGDTLVFNYVFGSEEYPDYNCSEFTDLFAFFLTGPGITGKKNLALIPGTNIPVAINTINNGRVNPLNGDIRNCTIFGPGSPFTNLYVDNSIGTEITYNGFSVVLTASSAVLPCQTYHMKLVIADLSDGVFDSGVFLEAKSLRTDVSFFELDAPRDVNGTPYIVEGCNTATLKVLRNKSKSLPQNLTLDVRGTAVNGTDFSLLPTAISIPAFDSVVQFPITPIVDNLDEGIEKIIIYLRQATACDTDQIVDSVLIDVRDYERMIMRPRDTGYCRNEAVQLYASSAVIYTTYSWTPATGLSDPSIFNPVATPPQSMNYTVLAVLGNCRAKDSVHVEMKALEITRTKNISCKNGNDGEILASGGYEWVQPVQYAINNDPWRADSLFTGLTTGTYTIKVRDRTGCVDSQRVTLIQGFPDLLYSDSAGTANCFGKNAKVVLKGIGGKAPYQFSTDGGTNFQPSNIFFLDEGNYAIVIKDSNNCVKTGRLSIVRDPIIRFSTNTTQATCTGGADGSIAFSATGGNGIYQYGFDTLQMQNAPLLPAAGGIYTVFVKDSKGCVDSQRVTVPVNNIVQLTAGNDTSICEGSIAQLQARTNAASVKWRPAATLDFDTAFIPTAFPRSTTRYTVTARLGVCTREDSVAVTVWPAPTATAGNDTTLCYGANVQLRGSGGIRYTWTPGFGLSDATIPNPIARPLRTTTYALSVKDIRGCNSLQPARVTINMLAAVKAFAGNDTLVAMNQPLQLQASGGISYVWSPGTGLSNAQISNPVALLTNAMVYYLLVTDDKGCTGRDTLRIKVYKGPDIYVPSAFTPNGDNNNDVLKALPVGLAKFDFFKIFNRWGQEVFSTTDPTRGWNGTIKGIAQPGETYVWMASGRDYKGNPIQRKGAVLLVR